MATCGTCPTCGGTTRETCASFGTHGHAWCECHRKLPISVIIPHLHSREPFLRTYCIPSLEKAAEVAISKGDGIGAQAARNNGADKATKPYLFFCDDDVRVVNDCLQKMYNALEKDSGAAFAYSDHEIVDHSVMTRTHFTAGPFDPLRLRRTSYVSTMSLMRREVFQPWDVTIRRMQDWDFWLCAVERGARGIYIPEVLFEMHVIDKGITATWTAADWQRVVREKHRIPEPV